jgi:hypothetical protein
MKKVLLLLLVAFSFLQSFAQYPVPNSIEELYSKIDQWIVPNTTKQIRPEMVSSLYKGVVNLMNKYGLDSGFVRNDTLYLTRHNGYSPIIVKLTAGGLESDPTVSPASKSITQADKNNWNSKQAALIQGNNISIVANVISVLNQNPVYAANQFLNRPISTTSPEVGQVYVWDGSFWSPQNLSAGGLADNWGSQVVQHSPYFSGLGTNSSLLELNTSLVSTVQRLLDSVGVLRSQLVDNVILYQDSIIRVYKAGSLIGQYTIKLPSNTGVIYSQGIGINITGSVIKADTLTISTKAYVNNQNSVVIQRFLDSIGILRNQLLNDVTLFQDSIIRVYRAGALLAQYTIRIPSATGINYTQGFGVNITGSIVKVDSNFVATKYYVDTAKNNFNTKINLKAERQELIDTALKANRQELLDSSGALRLSIVNKASQQSLIDSIAFLNAKISQRVSDIIIRTDSIDAVINGVPVFKGKILPPSVASVSDYINVTNYGAIANNSSIDNHDAILAAAAAANAQSKKGILLPPGTYHHRRLMILPYDNLEVVGYIGQTIIKSWPGAEGSTFPAYRGAFIFSKPGSPTGDNRIENPAVRGIIFDQSALDATTLNATNFPQNPTGLQFVSTGVVQMADANNPVIEYCKFIKPINCAILFYNSIGGHISYSRFEGLKNVAYTSPQGAPQMVDGNIINLHASWQLSTANKYGGVEVMHNYLDGSNGVWPCPITGVAPDGANILINVQTKGNQLGYGQLDGVKIHHNYGRNAIYGFQGEGQYVAGSGGVNISDNYLSHCVWPLGQSANSQDTSGNNTSIFIANNNIIDSTYGDVFLMNTNHFILSNNIVRDWGIKRTNSNFDILFTSNRNRSAVVKANAFNQQINLTKTKNGGAVISNMVAYLTSPNTPDYQNSVTGIDLYTPTENQTFSNITISNVQIDMAHSTKVHANDRSNAGILLRGKVENVDISNSIFEGAAGPGAYTYFPDNFGGGGNAMPRDVVFNNVKFIDNGWSNTFPRSVVELNANGDKYFFNNCHFIERSGTRNKNAILWNYQSFPTEASVDTVVIFNSITEGLTNPFSPYDLNITGSHVRITDVLGYNFQNSYPVTGTEKQFAGTVIYNQNPTPGNFGWYVKTPGRADNSLAAFGFTQAVWDTIKFNGTGAAPIEKYVTALDYVQSTRILSIQSLNSSTVNRQLPLATGSLPGLMSEIDKAFIDSSRGGLVADGFRIFRKPATDSVFVGITPYGSTIEQVAFQYRDSVGAGGSANAGGTATGEVQYRSSTGSFEASSKLKYNPNAGLEITSDLFEPLKLRALGSSSYNNILFHDYNNQFVGFFGYSNPDAFVAPNRMQLAAFNSRSLQFSINDIRRMMIDGSNGFVGVGDINPVYKLDVDGDIRSRAGLLVANVSQNNALTKIIAWNDASKAFEWRDVSTIGSAGGGGDMFKSTYDINNNGIVDNADAIAWSVISGKPTNFSYTDAANIFTAQNIFGGDNSIIKRRGVNGSGFNGFQVQNLGGTSRAVLDYDEQSGEVRIGAISNGGYFTNFYSNGLLAGAFGTTGEYYLNYLNQNNSNTQIVTRNATTNKLEWRDVSTIGSAGGGGDMFKATYDINNNGVVDNADGIAWSAITGKPSFATIATTGSVDDLVGILPLSKGGLGTNNPNGVLVGNGAGGLGTISTNTALQLFRRNAANNDYEFVDLTQSLIPNLITDLSGKENKSEKNTASGYAGLDGGTKLFSSQIPIGASAIGGVKNGGNVIIDGSGNMNAPDFPTLVPEGSMVGNQLEVLDGSVNGITNSAGDWDNNYISVWQPASGTTAGNLFGLGVTVTGTVSHPTTSLTVPWFRTQFASATTAGSVAGQRGAALNLYRGNAAGRGGFYVKIIFGQSLAATGYQSFSGLTSITTALTGDPSALLNMIGVGYDAADLSTGNYTFYTNDGTGAATEVLLTNPAAQISLNEVMELVLWCAPNASNINVKITNKSQNVVVYNTSVTVDLPLNNVFLAHRHEQRNGALTTAVQPTLAKVFIKRSN